MKIVYGLKESREALLTGRGMGLDSAPASILERTEAVFGKTMTPVETAEYIIARVRESGDDAVRDITKRPRWRGAWRPAGAGVRNRGSL